MWHEARKQERKIRGMMVDYKKRSERRRLYYHRIKADPTQFLRLQGASCKIFVEEEATEIEIAASALMPWQGQRSNMIDRFDVRANLDIIPEPENNLISSDLGENAVVDQKCQYERWRTLATNDLVGLGEDECLTQIAEDESAVLTKVTKKSASSSGAKIGFSYESNNAESESESDDSEADSKEFLPTDPDLDITFDVRELDAENKSKLNEIAAESYAIPDFTRLHIEDKVESEMREFEIREEQNRAERVAKLSKTERRKEKEERRKSKDVPPHMRVDDPYRNPHLRRSSSRRKDETDSSSDEEKTVQNIEISSARSNTYKNVKSVQKPVKKSLPVFLQPKTTSTVLSNLVAARKQLLSKNNEAFDFGVGPSAPIPVEASNTSPESKPVLNSRSRSRSPNKSRSRRSRSGNGYSRSSSRSRSRSRGRSRSRSRSRTRSRGRSRSRSRGRKYSSTSSRQRSRSRTKSGRGMSPRRKLSPVKDSRPKSPENRPKVNDMPLKKADSLKALKPHERLKLKLQSQLKKRQRDEKRKEQAQIEAKEQEAFERAEELRVLKRQMWEKEEEEYWKKREEEEKEYQKKKAEEKALKADDSSSNGEKPLSRSRSGSRRRHRSRSKSREKSAENHGSKRSKSTSSIQIDKKSTESAQKISLVPEYERADGEEASSRQSSRSRRDEVKDRSRTDDKRKRTEPADKQRSEEGRRRNRNDGDRRRGDAERKTIGENRESDRSRYQGGGERGDRTRHGEGRRRDDERGRHPEERTRYPEEPPRGRDRGSHRSLHR